MSKKLEFLSHTHLMEANSRLSRTTAVIAPSFKTFWFSMNWRVEKSNKKCLYFCKFNNFMFPRKPSWNFLYLLSQTDSQQGSSLFKKQVTLSTKSKTDELVHKGEQFNILNQKGLIICCRKQRRLSAASQQYWPTSRALAGRRKTELCLISGTQEIAPLVSCWFVNRGTI